VAFGARPECSSQDRRRLPAERPLPARDYDAVVVGARPAGAFTALLLARHGLRVLVIDRGRYGADTLSTHALMRGGVVQLARWGVLPRVQAADTPPVRRATFVYGGDALGVAVKPRDGVDALYAPRRTVLDPAVVDAALEAGAEVSYGTSVHELVRTPSGRVIGLVCRDQSGWTRTIRAGIVIGADGMRSTVARMVGAPITRAGRSAAAVVFGYWHGVPADGYRWYYADGLSVGAIPTNAGETCVFASAPTARFAELFREDIARGYHHVVREAAPDLVDAMQHGAMAGSLHGFPGQPGFYRRATGPGWALVGDAGYFKDPITAHGITDALIEAEHLQRAVVMGTDTALAAYDRERHERTSAVFEVTDRIASFEWTLDEARMLHKQLADAMSQEAKALSLMAREEAAV
jgi:flavin-dependent dehydrogenase